MLVEQALQPPTRDQPGAADMEIHQADDAALGQAGGEFCQCGQLARGEAAADDGADRGTRDDIGRETGFDQYLNGTDMSPAARRAAAERQADLRSDGRRLPVDRAHVVHYGTTPAKAKGSPCNAIPQHGPFSPQVQRISEADERKVNGIIGGHYRLDLTGP